MGLKETGSLPLMEMPKNKLSELFALAFTKKACMLNDRVAVAITLHGLFIPAVISNTFSSRTF